MKKYIISSKPGFTPAPEGQDQLLRLYAVYFIGTHFEWGKPQERILGYFEVPHQKMPDGRPFMVHKEYNLSLWRSKLLKDIEGLLGRKLKDHETNGFDAAQLLGRTGRADIVHKISRTGNERAEVGEISRVAPEIKVPPQHNPSVIYHLEDGMDETTLATLPKLVQKKIRESEEFNGTQPTKEEIAKRNMAQATQNAIAEAETDDAKESDDAEEPGDDEAVDAFDLDNYSSEDFRDSSVVDLIRKMIEDLPVSNAEKINQYRRLNRLVDRAQIKPDNGGNGGTDNARQASANDLDEDAINAKLADAADSDNGGEKYPF